MAYSNAEALPSVATFEESDAEAWHSLICKRFSESQFARNSRPAKFSGRLKQFELGSTRISSINASPLTYIRDQRSISADHVDGHIFMLVQSGQIKLVQNDSRILVKSGELFVYRHGIPFHLDFLSSYRAVSIWVPPDLMRVHSYNRSFSSPAVLDRSMANTNLAISMLSQLGSIAGTHGFQYKAQVSSAVLDVLVSSLPDQVDSATEDRSSAVIASLEEYVRRHIDDPMLSPERLANAGGISLRTLNRVFAVRGITPMRWVLQFRLNESYAALQAGKHATVIEAAFAYGFKDSSHFSRAFSALFGRPPSQVISSG